MTKHIPDRGVAATAVVAVCLLFLACSVVAAGAPSGTITVQGSAEGVGELVFADVDVIKPDGSPHKVKDTETGVVIVSDDVQPPPVVGDDPPQDLDGDGLYEDSNGDGSFTVGDVQALFDALSPIWRPQNPRLFNFDGKEPPEVTVSDLQALFQLLQGQN